MLPVLTFKQISRFYETQLEGHGIEGGFDAIRFILVALTADIQTSGVDTKFAAFSVGP